VKFSVCQLPDDLCTTDLDWKRLERRIIRDRSDIMLLNEMPFGPWLARESTFDDSLATASIHAHESALTALSDLSAAVISSRPVRSATRLSNEAFILAEGRYQAIHHKHYFPEEAGFFESSWFAPSLPGFEVSEYRGIRFGVLLCTELMFTEWARHYRRQGAHVIVCPRASCTSMRNWDAAARMASIASGCYVLSSNRVSRSPVAEPHFGGRGFAYSPTGELIGETSDSVPLITIEIDKAAVAEAQRNYPCYVRELPTAGAGT
jgi:N-carbamoylputrescine amidase